MSATRINKTGEPQVVPASDGRLTILIPIQIKRRIGRKLVTLPGRETGAIRPWDGERTPLQLALAQGHRWLAMLESGVVKSLREIARNQGVDSSYVSRMVNLTTLAPDIVAAILDEMLPPDVTLFDIAIDPPALWEEQRGRVGTTITFDDIRHRRKLVPIPISRRTFTGRGTAMQLCLISKQPPTTRKRNRAAGDNDGPRVQSSPSSYSIQSKRNISIEKLPGFLLFHLHKGKGFE